MLNFNKKKYVSFDNLSKFSGMIQKAFSDKLKNVETNLNEKIDSRFKSLTSKEQGDSEVIDAREGQVSLSENLKTYVKKEEFLTKYEHLNNKFINKIEEVKSNVNENTEYINKNKGAIQRIIYFVDSFRCEFSLSDNGYLKLPDVMGGFIIQWGVVLNDEIPSFNNTSYINYNTHFTNFPYFISLTPDALAGLDDRIYSTVDIKTQNFGIACNGGEKTNPLTTLKWFAIGK